MRLQFDPKISLGNLLTIAGGLLTLAVAAVTVSVKATQLEAQQGELKREIVPLVKSVTRIEAQMEMLLNNRRHVVTGDRAAVRHTPE